ncbi:MAG TPA: PspC domain-containing protein [Mycobacteriales bacterium]|nr:PspC domain-containing protein [Mycobacteriales bacterium]
MTESTTGTSAGGAPTPVRHVLTRSRDDRVVAGVCGGVGRYLGVDPVLFRVLLPVLAVFGGSGICSTRSAGCSSRRMVPRNPRPSGCCADAAAYSPCWP